MLVHSIYTRSLDAPLFMLIFQSKILFTAACSVAVLGTRLTRLQWLSLLLLSVGVVCVGGGSALVQWLTKHLWPLVAADALSDASSRPMQHAIPLRSGVASHHRVKVPAVGVAAVLSAALCSALASVYLEAKLKRHASASSGPPSLWLRNIQLSAASSVIAASSVALCDLRDPSRSPFEGIDALAFLLTSAWGGLGGILVALVLKHADSVLRGFAASAATILATIGSTLVLDFHPTAAFFVGATIVLLSMIAYSYGAEGSGSCEHEEAGAVNCTDDVEKAQAELAPLQDEQMTPCTPDVVCATTPTRKWRTIGA